MNLSRILLALLLAMPGCQALAQAADPHSGGPPHFGANRIVGLWQVNVAIEPCKGGPPLSFIAYNTYHAGGTLSDTNAAPPATRGPGQGIWEYMRRGQYKSRFQFYRYLPTGAFDGISDIRTNIVLDARATRYSSTVYARVLNPDGSLRVELCGSAQAERIRIH